VKAQAKRKPCNQLQGSAINQIAFFASNTQSFALAATTDFHFKEQAFQASSPKTSKGWSQDRPFFCALLANLLPQLCPLRHLAAHVPKRLTQTHA